MDKKTVEYNGLKGGLIILIGLIAYFYLMSFLGLEHNLNLRALNIIIMGLGVNWAIRSMKNANDEFDYLKGIGTGLVAAASSSILFAIFTFINLKFIDTAFLTEIVNREPFGLYLNPFKIAFIIVIEGFGSGFLLTFGLMQWYKKRVSQKTVNKDLEKEKTR